MRFSDESGPGERVCVVPAEKKNRPCTAVAWDPEHPSRLAAAWAKVRHDFFGEREQTEAKTMFLPPSPSLLPCLPVCPTLCLVPIIPPERRTPNAFAPCFTTNTSKLTRRF